MANIDVSLLVQKMANAAKTSLGDKWLDAEDYAESEFKKIGDAILFIEEQTLLGKMSERKAQIHLKIQKNAAKTVLLTLEGLGIIAVEDAINAALDVVKETVNTTLGFALV